MTVELDLLFFLIVAQHYEYEQWPVVIGRCLYLLLLNATLNLVQPAY
jgi:hypothetical protein